ncbi:MAG TPA: hypothetical protein VD963_06735 [Phycisphaerales bacterium]|nr:hypothetical protein [Phycisphaerales bacterium]
MNNGRAHNLSPELEAELLALVEQADPLETAGPAEAGVPTESSALQVRLRSDPRLRALLTSLRDDRLAISALGPLAAPAGLLAGIETALERAALVGLGAAEPASGIVALRPPGLGHRRLRFPSGVVARLAAAAAVAGALGLGVWGIVVGARSMLNDPSLRVARGLPEPEAGPDRAGPRGGRVPADSAGVLTLTHPARSPWNPLNRLTFGTAAARRTGPEAWTSAGDGRLAEPGVTALRTRPPLTPELALELARSGRLGVRVRSQDPELSLRMLDRIATQDDRFARWHAGFGPALAWADRAPVGAPAGPVPAPIVIADDTDPAPVAPGPVRPAGPRPDIAPEPVGYYLVSVRPRPAQLLGLRAHLRRAFHRVELVELSEPAPVGQPARELDPAAVLWWDAAPSPPDAETPLRLPIVVERLADR